MWERFLDRALGYKVWTVVRFNSQHITYEELQANSLPWSSLFPTTHNLIHSITQNDPTRKKNVEKQANSTRVILHKDAKWLLENYIGLKKKVEQSVSR